MAVSGQSEPVSLTIHWRLLELAEELLIAAAGFERDEHMESLFRARARCGTAIVLACAALESCANIVAGIHYEGKGQAAAARNDWPTDAKGRIWHRKAPHAKWQQLDLVLPPHFLSTHAPNWCRTLQDLFGERDEIVHFKGAWGPPGNEQDYMEREIRLCAEKVRFARVLVNALHAGYEKQHGVKLGYASQRRKTAPFSTEPDFWRHLLKGPSGTASQVFVTDVNHPTRPVDG